MTPRDPALPLAGMVLLLFSCGPAAPSAPAPAAPVGPAAPTAEVLEAPRIPVPSHQRALRTLAANLDGDAFEEQVILLQDRSNLSLPVTVQAADYDDARKTYYLAWEGQVLASASQPLSLDLIDLLGDHQNDLVIQGQDEAGLPTLDVLRPVPPSGGLGLAYKSIVSLRSKGSIEIVAPQRPDAYSQGQNSDISATVVVDEPDPQGTSSLDSWRTTWTWSFQKGEYVAGAPQKFHRETAGDAALEKVYAGDNNDLQAFLAGPWVKAISDKAGFLILFIDPASREISFSTPGAQEVYRWETASRSGRGSLYVVGSNDLIELISLKMGLTVTAADTIEVNTEDNPLWTGTYHRLEASAALALAVQGTQPLAQQPPPQGLFKDDKGNEFDFQSPTVRMKINGLETTGSVAVFPLGNETILQIKAPGPAGSPAISRAYSMVAKEESSTSRVVRTLRLQSGVLGAQGWRSDLSDPLRLEQVEGTTASGEGR